MTARLTVAEQNASVQQAQGTGRNESGVSDKKRLYPRELKDNSSFRSWSDRFISWLEMDNVDIGTAFKRAAKQDNPLNLSGLTPTQVAYSKVIYGHLRSLTEGYKKAAKIVRLVKHDNGLEAWRRLVRRLDPQNPEVHAAQLEQIITFGSRHAVKSLADVPMVLDQFERVLEDYEEVTGDGGINEATTKTIMMQLLPPGPTESHKGHAHGRATDHDRGHSRLPLDHNRPALRV